jgi:predicted nucleic acid-binding protein
LATRGPKPKSHRIWSLEDGSVALPERVVLDTSFIFEALVTTQSSHVPCSAYLVRLAENGTAVFYNRLLEMELAETSFKYALLDRWGSKRWRRMRHDGRARPRAARFMHGVLSAWRDVLDGTPQQRVDLESVADRVPGLVERYGLGSYDAVHAATAIDTGVGRIVALDIGFASVPERQLAVYTDRTRVGSCRRYRL